MGAFLQIRVSAATYDPAEVEKAWPKLCKIAWPPSGTPESGEIGVLRLADALYDQARFGDLPAETKEKLAPGAEKAAALKERLEQALGDRDPKTADALSYQIEDALKELEKAVA